MLESRKGEWRKILPILVNKKEHQAIHKLAREAQVSMCEYMRCLLRAAVARRVK